ncbi:MAG TPA: nuclear transport factor 2 family protein [Microlunatus sp.]
MTMTETTFNTTILRRGIEDRDASTLLDLYADDAEVIIVDRTNPPSSPQVMSGRAEIGRFLEQVSSRDMTHTLSRMTADASTAAYLEECEYPDGTKVLCTAMLDLTDGRIVRQVGVQAWDE